MSNTRVKVVVMFMSHSILNIDLIYTVTFALVTLLTVMTYFVLVLRKKL